MWRNFLSSLFLAFSVAGTFDEFPSKDTNIKCPSINEETERLHPPKFRGVWTSSRCEIRPGPEFLVRKYIFRRKKFKLHQFYYFDAQCTRPKYGITAEGSIKVQQMSWVVRGGAESEYRLYNVTINPYNKHFARKLSKRIKMYCKSLHGITVKRYRKYKIFNFPRKFQKSKDFDCTGLLSLSFHELQLLKVELKKTTNFNKHNSYLNDNKISRYEKPTRLLYLGNIHTDIKQRSTYRPYSYQTPLKKGNTRDCKICRKIKKSNEFKPPRLDKNRNQRRTFIDGYWSSKGCETRSYGQFLKRSLLFHANGVSWEGIYNFYRDPDCNHGSLSVHVSGGYLKERESRIIAGASDYKFNLTQMSVIPRDYFTTDTLNHARNNSCGIIGTWKIDSAQSVVRTKGCDILGLHVPTTEFEIIKLEQRQVDDVLLVGERPTDGKSLSGPSTRPTSFQPPLVRCMIERNNNELPDF
ncbi:unnamed protein product [Mytilus edulis]|uniref:APCDD1 domain-containing protein n=1 Tax=Mytilus edulis TaxID=6550 RepID=A0A8S3TNE3_MYTED|nr:unnamed protein product [Mytilus edulis]